MDLPTVLYRCPGPHSRPGGTYAYLGVESHEAYDKAVAGGWQLTMPDAIAAYEAKKAEVIAQVDKEIAEGPTVLPEGIPPSVPQDGGYQKVLVTERKKPGPKPKPKD